MSAPPQVQMHPQAQRNAHPSTSSSSPSPSPLASTPFFPSLDSILPPSRLPTPRRASSHAPSSGPTPRASPHLAQHIQQPPSHGLIHLDANVYPRYSLSSNSPRIHVLTASQYADLQEQYSRVKLPEKEMFPWAHGGADLPHSAAAQYFGFQRGTAAEVPNYRGLTTVYAPPPPPPTRPASRNILRRGLAAASFASWSSSGSSNTTSSSSSSGSPSPPPPSTPTCRLVSTFETSAILATSPATGVTTFNLPSPAAFHTVNLRHFALQAAKYASISDVVVYGENGIDESVVETATKVREAMDFEHEKRGGRGVRYNVFIISDSFSTFERNYPQLVAIDSLGFSRNRLNFFEREREEMRVLTQASEIGENVWLGNTQDVPMAKTHSRPLSSDSSSSLLDDGNPFSFAVCVESHDGSPLQCASTLARANAALNELEAQGQAYDEVRRLLTPENNGYIEAKTTVLRPHVDDMVHLESLSTGSALGNSTRAQTAFVNQIVDYACWIRDQASPPLTRGNHLPRRVLIHCADGYTETSLLALTYAMVSRRMSATEAYLFLQHDCQRSFFVYPNDRETILKIEHRVKDVLDREDDEEAAALRWHAEQQIVVAASQAAKGSRAGEGESPLDTAATSSGMERSDSGFVDSTPAPALGLPLQGGCCDEATAKMLEQATRDIEIQLEQEMMRPRGEMRLSTPQEDPWFFGQTFEGHFPSRILPFLYLGNLNHASNALMLKELGITHVVSLGESALNPPRAPNGFSSLSSAFRSPSAANSMPENSLWLEERLGNISVLDMKNVADDGIDSIRPCIDEALAFIEEARLQGGKILVHCKVGVSRSASIVIAYLMKEVKLDLASAYLLTRSRRLNILIQPNLPFMATLHAFEGSLLEERDARLAKRRALANTVGPTKDDSSLYSEDEEAADDDASGQNYGRAGLKRSNRLAFSYLCSQIAELNARFLA